MDCGHGEIVENVEGDRLSNLPDDLIYRILSYIGIKHVVQTSALSSRWRYIWTSMPYLNFSTRDFRKLPSFGKFVRLLLSRRNNQSEVFSVDLTFRGKVSQVSVQRILNYALSHNVQQLNITCLLGHMYCLSEFPPALFTSQSLKHFTFSGNIQRYFITATPTSPLPNLTAMNLTFYNDNCASLFSNCANLKNLTLKGCTMLKSFSIHHPGLCSLTFEDGNECVNLVTPQLKNLTIKHWRGIRLISAPNLFSLQYTDKYCSYKDNDDGPLQLPTDLRHLEKVDMIIHYGLDHEDKAYTYKMVCLLQQLHRVKFLTLSLELVEFLSSSVELISHQTSPFVNLKCLKVYPVFENLFGMFERPKVTMPIEVKNYLLGGSPGAAFTMVSHEEARAVKDVTLAQSIIRELQDNLKENTKTNTSLIEQDKAPMESLMASVCKQHEGVDRNVSMLQRISAILKRVPTSHPDKDKLEAMVHGLCVEVSTNIKLVNTILNHVKNQKDIHCDKTFHEPASSSQPSS